MCFYTDSEKRIIQEAASIILKKGEEHREEFTSPKFVRRFLSLNLATLDHEAFALILLDTRHRLIEYKVLFRGTIDGSAVYPREVAKVALNANAAAVIFAHNHPSGNSTPSSTDKALTNRLKAALDLIDVRTLDHFVIGFGEPFSFAENDYL